MDTGRGVRLGSLEQHQGYTVHLSRAVDVGAVMAVPLSGHAGPQGAIMMGRRRGRRDFTAAERDMADVFAGYAAVARELVQARADHQRLAVLDDRDRIARDLHDHVIQRLFAVGLSVQSLAHIAEKDRDLRLARIVTDIDDTIRQVRTSIFQLDSDGSRDSGLRAAVLTVVHQVTPALTFVPSVRFTGPVDTLIHGAVIGDVEAVVREGVTNVAKHARASEVSVQVSADGGWLSVDIADNGVGIDRPNRSSGLENLRRRAEELGGTLTIDHRQPGGTLIQWTIPVPD